jgi:hypothetical protein
MRQGIEPEELVFRYFDSFFEQGVPTDLQEIRWKHYEKKRLEKLAQVRRCVRKGDRESGSSEARTEKRLILTFLTRIGRNTSSNCLLFC